MFSEKTKAALGVLIIVALFVLSSYFVRTNIEAIKSFIGDPSLGILIYIIITIFAIVFAPVSMMPLIPVASNIFGWVQTGFINVIGWFIGSIIVFFISRKYGVSLIKKFISLDKITKLESKIPEDKMFVSILLLRMTVPIDILSYALGLFSKVKFKTYAIATFLGIIPFSFVFSYLGVLPVWYQVIGFLVIGFVIALIIEYWKK
jgi:uncharacterized membrane protein YdjX (TVP38/TMEM64 family)|tara:strand:+ start:12 stop:623 length:612 start_codon:yes stop_codon:yes gene_type:complete